MALTKILASITPFGNTSSSFGITSTNKQKLVAVHVLNPPPSLVVKVNGYDCMEVGSFSGFGEAKVYYMSDWRYAEAVLAANPSSFPYPDGIPNSFTVTLSAANSNTQMIVRVFEDAEQGRDPLTSPIADQFYGITPVHVPFFQSGSVRVRKWATTTKGPYRYMLCVQGEGTYTGAGIGSSGFVGNADSTTNILGASQYSNDPYGNTTIVRAADSGGIVGGNNDTPLGGIEWEYQTGGVPLNLHTYWMTVFLVRESRQPNLLNATIVDIRSKYMAIKFSFGYIPVLDNVEFSLFKAGSGSGIGPTAREGAMNISVFGDERTVTFSGLTPSTLYEGRYKSLNMTPPGSNEVNYFYTLVAPYLQTTQTPAAFGAATSSITSNSVDISSNYYNGNDDSYTYIVYGTSPGVYTSSTPEISLPRSLLSSNLTKTISGLLPNTTYYYKTAIKVDHVYSTQETYLNSTEGSFTTGAPLLPIVAPLATTAKTHNSATITGEVNPRGLSGSYYFKYGTTTAMLSSSAVTPAGSLNSATTYSLSLTGLTPSTTYYYTIVGTNANGSTQGSVASFVTNAAPVLTPVVTTAIATLITTTTAQLNGTVNPNGDNTNYLFRYGTDAVASANQSTSSSLAGSSGVTNVSLSLSGLTPGVTYYFKIEATNSFGTVTSSIISFTTLTTLNVGNNTTPGSTASNPVTQNVAQGTSNPLTATAGGGGAGRTYLWSTGETTQTINPSTLNPGTYNFSVVISDGTTSVTQYFTIVVAAPNYLPLTEISSKEEWDRIRIYPKTF